MGWFQSKQDQLAENLQEEQAYALAAFEIANGEIRPGLWAKAFAEAAGNEQRAQGNYIKLRVDQVKLGVEVTAAMIARATKTLSEPVTTTPVPLPALPVSPPPPPEKPICKRCGSSDIASLYPSGRFSCRDCSNVQMGCKRCGFDVTCLSGNTYECLRCHMRQLINSA